MSEGLREVTLPSGRKMEVAPAPFVEAKRLYQAIAGEMVRLSLNPDDDVTNLMKNVICLAVFSPNIEAALEPCLRRCTYQGTKIIPVDSFESIEGREDYLDVCFEVAKENVGPFTKSLYAQFKKLRAGVEKLLPSSA